MYAEAGHFALVLAFAVSIVQATVPLIGAEKGDAMLMSFAKPAAMSQFLLTLFAFLCLMVSYVTSDFSVASVVQNSHSAKPLLYKISGVWGNHEGSMLLWVLILTIFGAAVTVFGRGLPAGLKARALAVQSMIGAGFFGFILFTSNPFERVFPIPLDGTGLNPLLQDPGLALHPPFLYLGYVGFSMAFSFAIAALIEGRVDAAWARWVRPWTLAAWAFLTIGIVLGSWWAYYELGWGGWWFWDPVENASFMPWLAGTALLHSSIVVEKRDALKGWTIFLAILAFSFSLLGTFLVRSGILTSVHAFATDPDRGLFILFLLVAVTGGSLALFAIRGPSLKTGGLFQPISREGSLLLNNLLMTIGAAAVLLGTLYPLLLDAVGGGKVSVGPPFFNSVFIPLMVPMIIAMAIGPIMAWKRADLMAALRKLWLGGVAILIAVAFTWGYVSGGPLIGLIGIAMAAWLGIGTVVELAERIKLFRIPLGSSLKRLVGLPRSTWGMTLAHGGLAIMIAGMVGAGVWKIESVQNMKPGDTVRVESYDFTFEGVREVKGPNYVALQGTFSVTKDGKLVSILASEKRNYPVERMPTTEAGITSLFRGDLYAVIGEPHGDDGTFATRIYFNPLVAWMWWGCVVMVVGAGLSLSDRKHRIGAPSRKKAQPSDGAAAPAKA